MRLGKRFFKKTDELLEGSVMFVGGCTMARDWLRSPDATLHPVRKSTRRLQWRPEQGRTKAELLTVQVQQHSLPLTTQHKKSQHSASTWAWTELMVGGAAFSALLLAVDAEEIYIAGGNGEALEEIGRSTRRVFNGTCTSGSACCQVPPCRPDMSMLSYDFVCKLLNDRLSRLR